MPDHIFHVEHLTAVTIRFEPRIREEHAGEAWVLLDTVHTDTSIWRVFEDWFQQLPDDQKQAGQYRVIEIADYESGVGTVSAHTVKPSWSVEPYWEQPRPETNGEANGVTQVA